MKRIIAILACAMLVMGFASFASAEVTLGGDARVRGIWQSNYDLDDSADDDARWFDQRVRLTITGKTAGGTEVRMRVTASEGQWDGTAQTGNQTHPASPGTVKRAFGIDTDDYAYINIPMGDFQLAIGRMLANWGNKFMGWESATDRIKLSYKVSDDITVLYLYDKKGESSNMRTNTNLGGDDNLDDFDQHGGIVLMNAGDLKTGLIVLLPHDNRPIAPSPATTTAKGNIRDSGYVASLFVNGNVGVNLMSEFAVKGGDMFATTEAGKTDENMQMGFFVSASQPMDNLTVGALVAMTMSGYTADDDFQPTVFIGTKQPTAQLNLGQCVYGGTCDTTAVVLNASMKISDDMSAKAVFGYVMQDAYSAASSTNEADIMEVDLGMSYKIMDNVNYTLDFGYAMVDPANSAMMDDPAMALAHKIEVKF